MKSGETLYEVLAALASALRTIADEGTEDFSELDAPKQQLGLLDHKDTGRIAWLVMFVSFFIEDWVHQFALDEDTPDDPDFREQWGSIFVRPTARILAQIIDIPYGMLALPPEKFRAVQDHCVGAANRLAANYHDALVSYTALCSAYQHSCGRP